MGGPQMGGGGGASGGWGGQGAPPMGGAPMMGVPPQMGGGPPQMGGGPPQMGGGPPQMGGGPPQKGGGGGGGPMRHHGGGGDGKGGGPYGKGRGKGRGGRHDGGPGGGGPGGAGRWGGGTGAGGRGRFERAKNDYAQHFVDTGLRPANFIRDSDVQERFEEYPKLKELIEAKDTLINERATEPTYKKVDLHTFDLTTLGTKFDVILVDPPWEEYRRRKIACGAMFDKEADEIVWKPEDIMNLRIDAIGDTPSFVFLWAGSGVSLQVRRLALLCLASPRPASPRLAVPRRATPRSAPPRLPLNGAACAPLALCLCSC